LLIAMTAFGLAATRFAIDNLLGGQTTLVELFKPPEKGWSAVIVMLKVQDALVLPLTMTGAWTFLLPILRMREARRGRVRLGREPGMTACVAAIVGMGAALLWMVLARFIGILCNGNASVPWILWFQAVIFGELLVYAGLAVFVVWVMQALSGRWRPVPDWKDRLGRALGVLWIVTGFVWSVRSHVFLL
jgi:hypothetical protein